MTPTHIEMIRGEKIIGTLKVDPGEENSIKSIKGIAWADIKIGCNLEDKEGSILPEGPKAVLRIKKFSSENDQNGIIMEAGKSIPVSGHQVVEVSSPFYDESIRVTHKPAPRRDHIGNIPLQPA